MPSPAHPGQAGRTVCDDTAVSGKNKYRSESQKHLKRRAKRLAMQLGKEQYKRMNSNIITSDCRSYFKMVAAQEMDVLPLQEGLHCRVQTLVDTRSS